MEAPDDQMSLFSELISSLEASRSHAPISARRAEAWDSSEESEVPYGWKCLESSKLSARLGFSLRTFLLSALAGLTPSSLGWKRQATPRGRWWWALGRSARHTGGTESGSLAGEWLTPKATYSGRTAEAHARAKATARERHEAGMYRKGCGVPTMDDLQIQAIKEDEAAMWATPTRRDEKGPGPRHTKGGRDLCTDVAEWPTPTAQSYGSNQGGSAGRVGPKRPSLEQVAREATGEWPTPTACDANSSGAAGYSTESGRHPGTTLTDAAVRMGAGRVRVTCAWGTAWMATEDTYLSMPCPGCAEIRSGEVTFLDKPAGPPAEASPSTFGKPPARPHLNPAWVEQLMGAPDGWTDLPAETVSELWATRTRRTSPS